MLISSFFSSIYDCLGLLPFDWLQPRFMRQALVGLCLLAPVTSMLGIHVLNFRMAFFSDAVGHSAFAGLAVGLLLGISPQNSMLIFGVLVGLAIMAVQRKSGLSADAAIGIVFSAVVAFGLAVVSRTPNLAREIQQFLYGDILTIAEGENAMLLLLLTLICIFEFCGWNRMLTLALSPTLARASGIATYFWQYLFAALLALTVMFSVRAVGVLLVTALLIVPPACARKLACSIRGMFWWSILVSSSSAIIGLYLSAQEWMGTASGATVILITCMWFAIACFVAKFAQMRS